MEVPQSRRIGGVIYRIKNVASEVILDDRIVPFGCSDVNIYKGEDEDEDCTDIQADVL